MKARYLLTALFVLTCAVTAKAQAKPDLQTNVSLVLSRMQLQDSVDFVGEIKHGDAIWARPRYALGNVDQLQLSLKNNRIWKHDAWWTRIWHLSRSQSYRLLMRPSLHVQVYKKKDWGLMYMMDIDRFPPALRRPVDSTLHLILEIIPHKVWRTHTSQELIFDRLTHQGNSVIGLPSTTGQNK